MTQLGGTNVQSSAPEVRDILEKGVADAVTFPWGSVPLFGIDKVTKYHMEVPLYVTTFAFVFNKDKYAQMSAAQKKVIDNHCTNEWALKVASNWADFEHGGIAKLKADPAHEVYTITPAQLTEWKTAAQPLEKTWADNVKKSGGDGDSHHERAQGRTDQVQSGLLMQDATGRRGPVDRFIDAIEVTAAGFLAVVTLLTFVSVLLRYFFAWAIPDSYDFTRLLLGIVIFWGMAVASYRGDHITVDLLWAASPSWR